MARKGSDSLGKRIVRFRELKGWSQTQLWTAAGIKQPRMSNLENDKAKPRFEEMEIISLLLEHPLDDFSILRKGAPPEPEA